MDLNRNIAQVQTSCWNYHYSAGTATGGLGTTSPENFAFSVERGKACKYFFHTGTINKGPVYPCYHERFSLLTEIDKEMSISYVLTNN